MQMCASGIDPEIALTRFDIEPAVDTTIQVDGVLTLSRHRSDRLLFPGSGIEHHHVRLGHPDQAGDGAIRIDKGIIVHIHLVHAAIVGELAGLRVVAGQIGGPVTADP
jgi:hypothetical protein